MKERKEIRCGHCNRLLGKGEVLDVEIKCPRCKTINYLRAQSPCSEPHDGHCGAKHADEKKENKTETYIVVGPYRIAVPREVFIAWEKALMLEAGFTDKEIKAEILRRLGYE